MKLAKPLTTRFSDTLDTVRFNTGDELLVASGLTRPAEELVSQNIRAAEIDMLLSFLFGKPLVVNDTTFFDSRGFLVGAERVLRGWKQLHPRQREKSFFPFVLATRQSELARACHLALKSQLMNREKPFLMSSFPRLSRDKVAEFGSLLTERKYREAQQLLTDEHNRAAQMCPAPPKEWVHQFREVTSYFSGAVEKTVVKAEGVVPISMDKFFSELCDLPNTGVCFPGEEGSGAEVASDVIHSLKDATRKLRNCGVNLNTRSQFRQLLFEARRVNQEHTASKLIADLPSEWPVIQRVDFLCSLQQQSGLLDGLLQFFDIAYNKVVASSNGARDIATSQVELPRAGDWDLAAWAAVEAIWSTSLERMAKQLGMPGDWRLVTRPRHELLLFFVKRSELLCLDWEILWKEVLLDGGFRDSLKRLHNAETTAEKYANALSRYEDVLGKHLSLIAELLGARSGLRDRVVAKAGAFGHVIEEDGFNELVTNAAGQVDIVSNFIDQVLGMNDALQGLQGVNVVRCGRAYFDLYGPPRFGMLAKRRAAAELRQAFRNGLDIVQA